jgi:hypothetical protein
MSKIGATCLSGYTASGAAYFRMSEPPLTVVLRRLVTGRDRVLDANPIVSRQIAPPVALALAPSALPGERPRRWVELAGEPGEPPLAFMNGNTRCADREPGQSFIREREHE